MPKIVPIVEGTGEVKAVPNLLYKILHAMQRYDLFVDESLNAHGRENLLKSGGVERFVQLACIKKDCIGVLCLLDAEGDCPCTLAQGLSNRLQVLQPRYSVVIVVAKCEYEAWFLASLETIVGQPFSGGVALPSDCTFNQDVETKRNVKGWLTGQLPHGHAYKETLDQEILTRHIDLNLAPQKSRSFRRLWHAMEELVQSIDANSRIITPR